MKKNQNNININRAIKIQIISRELAIENTYGSNAYILDLVQYLQQAGCKVDYVAFNPVLDQQFPWYVIPSSLAKTATVSVLSSVRINNVLLRFNSLPDWIAGLLRLIYRRLPLVKNIYTTILDKLKKPHQEQDNSTNALVTDWQNSLATPEEIAFAKAQFTRFKPDVLIINYVYLTNILDALAPNENILKVILTHDVLHHRNAYLKKIGVFMDEGDWDWDIESKHLRKAQVLLAIQEEDANTFKQMAPQSQVICMPKSAVCYSHTIKQVPGRCLFVGSEAQHNYYSLKWFLENVWPEVIKLVPNCSLHVCGSIRDVLTGNYPNVNFMGRVANLEPEYAAAEVCLVPLLAGSGLKIKLVEAMAHGRACVSTSMGIQGLRDIAGKTALVADTAEDFAAAVHTLLTKAEERQLMEEQAYRYVTENLSAQAAYQPFLNYIHQHLRRDTMSISKINPS